MLAVGKTAGRETQDSVADDHVGIGRNDVDMVALDLDSIGYLRNRNFSGARKNFFQCAVVARIKMLQKHKSHARSFRQIG